MQKEYVYVENHQDITSLKQRIKQLTQKYLKRFPKKERYWTEAEREKNSSNGLVKDEKLDRYPAFLIYNSLEEWSLIGVCYKGWKFSSGFRGFLVKYLKERYREDRYFDYLQAIPRKRFIFYTPEWSEMDELDLISEELLDLHLREFLDGEKIPPEIKEAAFHKELMNRNYPLSNLEQIVSSSKDNEVSEEIIDKYFQEFIDKQVTSQDEQ